MAVHGGSVCVLGGGGCSPIFVQSSKSDMDGHCNFPYFMGSWSIILMSWPGLNWPVFIQCI